MTTRRSFLGSLITTKLIVGATGVLLFLYLILHIAGNLLVFLGAFGLQWGIGILVDALQTQGWASDAAFRAAFFTLLGGQLLALLWMVRPGRQV